MKNFSQNLIDWKVVAKKFYVIGPRREIFEKAYAANITCAEITKVYYDLQLCSNSDYPNNSVVISPQAKKVSDFLYEYAKANFAILKIFINYPFYTRMTRDEETTLLSVIANAGGLLGLCMGLSFVSIFEIFYFCFDAFMVKIKKLMC